MVSVTKRKYKFKMRGKSFKRGPEEHFLHAGSNAYVDQGARDRLKHLQDTWTGRWIRKVLKVTSQVQASGTSLVSLASRAV